MPNAAELIQEVYIDPIKSVLFIDDKFPTYAQTLQGAQPEPVALDGGSIKQKDEEQYQNPFESEPKVAVAVTAEAATPDVERVLQLTQSCRACGYIFDVENSANAALGPVGEESFINKADFVVLDFILDDKADSGKDALNIIDHLNNTKRFNMVVVYTNNDPFEVAQEIAHFLRGKNESVNLSKKALRRLGDIPNGFLANFFIQYLSGELTPLDEWFATQGLSGKPNKTDIENKFEEYANERFFNAPVRSKSLLRGCGTTEGDIPWICGIGVFIAVVRKDKASDTIKTLLEMLKDCLATFFPSPISMLIHKSINTLKEGGTAILEQAFEDKEMRAALLYRAMTAEFKAVSPEKIIELRFGDLMRKALSVLSFEVQSKTADFGRRLLSHCTSSCVDGNDINTATKLEKCGCDDERQLFLKVNAALCCQPVETGHVTTGMIFRQINKPSNIWICATPACDLVPGREGSGKGYRRLLYPANYFEALKIHPATELDAVLAKATQANHLFINVNGTIQAFRIFQESNRQPQSYIFYTQDGGYLSHEHTLKLLTICPKRTEGSTSLVLTENEFEVIGQLRQEYASRFLAINGDWNSRIGVDFVDFGGNDDAAN